MSPGKEIRTNKPQERSTPKVLDHLRIYQGEDGGHIVEHNFSHYEHPAEKHVFGQSEGPAALAHIAKNAKIDTGKADDTAK